MFERQGNRLVYRFDSETLWIEPWGPNALRVRATKHHSMPPEDWALDEPVPDIAAEIFIPPSSSSSSSSAAEGKEEEDDKYNDEATIAHGTIRATVSRFGKVTVRNAATGEVMLEEYARHRRDVRDPKCSALEVEAREFRPLPGGGGADHFALTLRLEGARSGRGRGSGSGRGERLFGMGQYQHEGLLDLRGADLELAQRNSQASVPFLLSSRGYGLLWNNPAVGRAVLGSNIISFSAAATRKLDYWLVVSESGNNPNPRELVLRYAAVTGRPPPMPEYGLGFWQSKLRYQTQEEVISVAREYARRKLPLSVLVVDFFHWPAQGEWRFDPAYWPDPAGMVRELRSLGVEPMVSIWPTVEPASRHWDEMVERGLLIRSERGFRAAMDFQGNTVHFDATNPEARAFVWDQARRNYYRDCGIRLFWLDEAEPEYKTYDFDNWRYHLGSCLAVGNIYPREYSRAFYEGALEAARSESSSGPDSDPAAAETAALAPNLVNLVRCAWAGSQKFGALVWSGDVASSWESLRQQLAAGLNMGLAGIPYWTTDIGGFHGGDPTDPGFRELLVRWFQWGAFLPVFRLHGDRYPNKPPLDPTGRTGGGRCPSGADNEVWSYGEAVGAVLERYMFLRERMRDYVRAVMREASDTGAPVMRTLFYEFPEDPRAWEVEDQYMFGSKYLVAPILYPHTVRRAVYFPAGASWKSTREGETTTALFEGGQTVEVDAPIEWMPVFERV